MGLIDEMFKVRYHSCMPSVSPDPDDHPDCRYCQEIFCLGTERNAVEFNKPLLESRNFVAVPTLGHFVPGWLLIIPRKHYICVGSLSVQLRDELKELKIEAERLLSSIYGPIVKFEHGPSTKSTAGICVV